MASVRVSQILTALTTTNPDVGSLPQQLVTACAQAVPVTGVALVLMTDDGPAGSVAATDGPAATMEELQFTLGEGPCVDSSRTGRPVLQSDLARSGPARWPGFTAGALEAGIEAIYAFPLRIGSIRLGVLDLYRDRAGALTAQEEAEALSFSDAATTLLLHLQSQASPDAFDAVAIPVIQDRAQVHQATGMIAEEAGVSMASALMLLRARAFAADVPIVSLAQDVLAGVVRFSEDGGIFLSR